MKTITVDELAELLSESSSATLISFIAETDARLKKTGNPYGTVYKVAQATGTLGADYEKKVNRQIQRENPGKEVEKFEAGPRKWGSPAGRLVEKDGDFYLNFSPNRVDVLGYKTSTGKPIDAELVEPFLPKKSEPTNQPVEKKTKICNYSLSNIRQISFNGAVYKVKRNVPKQK